MKRITTFFAVAAVLLGGAAAAFAQRSDTGRVNLVFGPRVGAGATVMFVDSTTFTETVREMAPDPRDKYYPVFTQFGVSLEQRIRLGDTESHFAFQEILHVGGLDQGLILPSLNVLIGFRSRLGLELGFGPNITVQYDGVSFDVPVTVVYAVGWTFNFSDVYIPVDIAVMPTPRDGHIRLTLMTGFNFDIGR
jgi:hypothetical protein